MFGYTPFQSNFDPAHVSTVSVYDEVNMDLFGAGFRYFVTNEIAVGLGLTLEQDQLRKNLKMVMKLNLHRQHLEWLLMQIIISKSYTVFLLMLN